MLAMVDTNAEDWIQMLMIQIQSIQKPSIHILLIVLDKTINRNADGTNLYVNICIRMENR